MKRLTLMFLLLLPSAAAAHDFWIEPSTFRPPAKTSVAVRLRVGEHYLGDPVPRKPAAQLIRFDAHAAGGTIQVTGAEGSEPAGSVAVPKGGLTLISYESKPAYVELNEDKLEQYYREEGLEFVRDMRKRSPFAREPWRELFSRCAKSLLMTGSASASGFDHRVGMRLELIPVKNPYANRAGIKLPVRLLYLGKPLAGALVVGIPKSHPDRKVSARSDAAGRVTLKLDQGGEWLIKAVHIAPAPAGARGQWESFWASLTFDLRP